MKRAPKPLITAENYTRLLPRPGRERDRLKDTGRGAVPGLTLTVTAAGSRRWVYIYRERGTRKKVFLHLGDVADLGLSQARVKARAERALRDNGRDPREERRRTETERRAEAREAERLEGETLAAAVAAFLEAKRDTWAPATQRERDRIASTYVAQMPSCARPVALVRPFDVEADLKPLRPVQANRVRSLLLAASRWATKKELLTRDVMSATERPHKEASRTRTLDADELRAVWRGRSKDTPEGAALPARAHAYLRVLLLCGTRRGETAAADWSDVDLDGKVWNVPAEARKNRKALTVPLSSGACAVFKALGPRRDGRVFPATIAATPGRLMTSVRAALGIVKDSPGDWTLHDLRRCYATGLQQLGVAPHIVTAALGQTAREPGVADATSTYARYDYLEERRTANEAWARRLEQLNAEGEAKAADVVPIRRGRRR